MPDLARPQAYAYGYDGAGSLSAIARYDASGTTQVASAQGRFKYDARNRRVARQAGGQWTYVVSDGAGSPLSELALAGGTWTKVRDHVWLEGRLVAQVEYAWRSPASSKPRRGAGRPA